MKTFIHKKTPRELAAEREAEQRELRKVIASGDFEVKEQKKEQP